MENEILEAERQRNEILKRIQEKERLLNLIQSKHIKGGLKEVKEFQEKYNLKKNQQEQKEQNEDLNKSKASKISIISKDKDNQENIAESKEVNEKEFAKLKFNSFLTGVNYVGMIKKVQRAFRDYLVRKNKKRLRNYYLNKLIQEFYKPISYERGAELRKLLIQKLKQWRVPEAEYQEIVNRYFEEYQNFCFTFPEKQRIREENFFTYYQCLDLLNYMENIKPETALNECNQFKQFMLNKNKEYSTKLMMDEKEKQYKYNIDVEQYNIMDEFEENNILDEIDNRYNFESRSSILNKKP